MAEGFGSSTYTRGNGNRYMEVWCSKWYVRVRHAKLKSVELSLIFNKAITWFSAAVLGPFLVDPVCHSKFFGRYDVYGKSLKCL